MRATSPERGAWTIVSLLFLFMLINFIDKAVIGLAGVPIMQELGLTPRQFGLIGSGFFFLFSISAVLVGFLVNRVETRWALLVMALVWALTQFPMVGAVGFSTFLACRIALGAGEGPAYPVALHATYKWFPNESRTLPTAIISQGASIGVMGALPALNWVIIHWSWHWAFGILGVAGLAWTLAWLLLGREGQGTPAPTSAAGVTLGRVPYMRLFLTPSVLASWCAFFGAYWALSLGLAWQTPFLIKGLGFSQHAAGFIAALPWGLSVITTVGLGWASQRLLQRGVPSRFARGMLGGAAVALSGLGLIVMPAMPSPALMVAFAVLAGSLPGIIYVISHAVVSEITPAAQRGAMLAIGNAVGSSAGLIAPYVMGSMVETAATPLEGFNQGYLTCGVIMVVCGAIGVAFIRPEADIARLAGETRSTAPVPVPGE